MHEVETQAIGRHERAGLLDMRAKHLAQRRMDEVRRSVIAACCIAQRAINFGGHQIANRKTSFDLLDTVRPRQTGPESYDAGHARSAGAGVQPSLVGDLSARFDIERRPGEYGVSVPAILECVDRLLLRVEEREYGNALHDRIGIALERVTGVS